MNKRLLENYIRNALLTEQQRIDENRLLTLGLAGLMSATAFVGSISDSLAKDLNIPGVEEVGPGVYEVNGKTFNVGYFLKKGKLKINSRQIRSLVKIYGPVIHKVLSALTKNSPQLRGRTKNLDTRKYRGTRKLKRSTGMQTSQQQKLNYLNQYATLDDNFCDLYLDDGEGNLPKIKREFVDNFFYLHKYAQSFGLTIKEPASGNGYRFFINNKQAPGNVSVTDIQESSAREKLPTFQDYRSQSIEPSRVEEMIIRIALFENLIDESEIQFYKNLIN